MYLENVTTRITFSRIKARDASLFKECAERNKNINRVTKLSDTTVGSRLVVKIRFRTCSQKRRLEPCIGCLQVKRRPSINNRNAFDWISFLNAWVHANLYDFIPDENWSHWRIIFGITKLKRANSLPKWFVSAILHFENFKRLLVHVLNTVKIYRT